MDKQSLIKVHDTFNFLLSQLRIKVEQSFGIMVSRWQILKRPLQLALKNVPPLVLACMRLHNYIINEGDTFKVQIEALQTYQQVSNGHGYIETTIKDSPWIEEELNACENVPGTAHYDHYLFHIYKNVVWNAQSII